MNVRHCALAALLLSAIQGCDIVGPLVVKPGSTVDVISASRSEVTLEYTHDYDFELPAAGRIAERECNRFGKDSAFVSTTWKNIDRSYATFRCE
jgi:hypothetical protein